MLSALLVWTMINCFTILGLTVLYIMAPGWLNIDNFLLRDPSVFYGAVGLVLAMGPVHLTLFYYQVQKPFLVPWLGGPLLLPPAAKLFDME